MLMFPLNFPHPQEMGAPPVSPEFPPSARVQAAMNFLYYLYNKEKITPVASDIAGVTEVSGLVPTPEEKDAAAEACEMLRAYFAGKLQHDPWEKLRYDSLAQQINKSSSQKNSQIINCPECYNKSGESLDCNLCKGGGKVSVSPVSNQAAIGQAFFDMIMSSTFPPPNKHPENE